MYHYMALCLVPAMEVFLSFKRTEALMPTSLLLCGAVLVAVVMCEALSVELLHALSVHPHTLASSGFHFIIYHIHAKKNLRRSRVSVLLYLLVTTVQLYLLVVIIVLLYLSVVIIVLVVVIEV